MSDSLSTRASLLERVKDRSDELAWSEFVRLYAPLVYSYGRRRGLQDADAADLAQDVLRIAAEKIDRFQYDPARGEFRGWLLTVSLNRVRRFMTTPKLRDQGTGRSTIVEVLQQQPDRAEQDSWNQESRMQLFRWATEQIRPDFQAKTWQAFWWTAVEQKSAATVATELGISVGSVYVAKSRVVARLREKLSFVDVE